LAAIIEVFGRQPCNVAGLDPWPVIVGHREPGGVAILALDDHVMPKNTLVMPKNTLKDKAEPLGGTLRGLVEIVALPFEASITQFVEDVLCEKVECLSRNPSLSDRGSPKDVSNLDNAMNGINPHQGLPSLGPSAPPIDN